MESRERAGARPDPTRIMGMANAFYSSCALFAASDAGIFATLAESPGMDVAAVASSCGLDARGARLLMDACVGLGLLDKEGGAYRNSAEAAAFLVPGRPMDLSRAIRYNRDVYAAWGRLPEFVRTGRPVERPELHLGEDKARTRAFVLAMHGRAMGIGRAVVPALNLSGRRRLLDLGGGSGAYSMLLAEAYPEMTCTMMDLPEVSAVARELVEARGLSERVNVVDGNYRSDAFPAGNDVIILFGMLHQESPDSIRSILRRSHDALTDGGMVCVLDMMTDATRSQPLFSALFGLNMALTTENGWVFSSEDLDGWLREAGFDQIECRQLPPPMPHALATARKA